MSGGVRTFAALTAHILLLGTLVCPAPSVLADDAVAPGTPVEFELALGAVRRHPVRLEAEQLLQVAVHEKGPRVVLTLLDDKGANLARREAPADTIATVRMLFVAPIAGAFTLEVQSSGEGRPGTYEIGLEEPRPAGDREKARALADDSLAEAVRLANEGSGESRRLALARFEAAEAGFREAGDRAGEALALLKRGRLQFDAGQPAAAASIERSLALFRELEDREGEGAALLELGWTTIRTGDLDKARALFDTAAANARAIDSRWMLSAALSNMGVTYDRGGEAEKAAGLFKQGLAVATEAGSRWLQARATNSLGVCHMNLGDGERALEYYDRALALVRAIGNRAAEIATLGGMASVYLEMDEDARAIALLDQVIPLAQAAGLADTEARNLNSLARALGRGGETARAIEVGRRSLELRRRMHDPAGEAASLALLGINWHRSGDSEAGLEHLREALRLRQALGDRYATASTLGSMAWVEHGRGNFPEARARAEAAITLIEGIRSAMTSPDLRASYVAYEQNIYAIYIDSLMRMHERDPTAGHETAALEASERARARVLLDALIEARADVREGVAPDLLERERALQGELSRASSRLSRAVIREAGPDEVRGARADLERKSEDYRELQARIRRESPRYAALTQPSPITVEQIRGELLDDETVLLEFYLAKDRSYLWAATRSAVLSRAIPGRATIDAAARKVHGLTIERQRTRAPAAVRKADRQLQAESKALSRLLLGGVADLLEKDWKGKRLLIVTSGALAYLPFEALPSPAGDEGRPLLLDHEIVFAPSASVLFAQRQEARPPAATASAAVIADPVFERADPRVHARGGAPRADAPSIGLTRAIESLGRSGFTRLPFSRREADAIAAFVPPSALLKATDFAASRALVARGALDHHRIVHFATHGLLDSEHPDLSGLVLSLVDEKGAPVDGFLRMHEIYNLHLPADLVVLSACQTALGREIRGEGLIGLTRGFMYAGARAVVASLWQVDDESTAELMKRFYRGMLKENRRPADALRAAQLQMSRDPRWAAPFYWAGFVLQGEFR